MANDKYSGSYNAGPQLPSYMKKNTAAAKRTAAQGTAARSTASAARTSAAAKRTTAAHGTATHSTAARGTASRSSARGSAQHGAATRSTAAHSTAAKANTRHAANQVQHKKRKRKKSGSGALKWIALAAAALICVIIIVSIANSGGADAVVTPEKGLDLDALAAQLKQGEKLGKSSNIILLSEGVCSAQSLKEQLAAVTDMTLRTVTLGHVQRGGSPSLRDRLLAARFGVKAIECLIAGKKAVAVGVRNEEIVADDLQKALAYPAADRSELFRVCEILCR